MTIRIEPPAAFCDVSANFVHLRPGSAYSWASTLSRRGAVDGKHVPLSTITAHTSYRTTHGSSLLTRTPQISKILRALGVTQKGPATEEEDATVPERVKSLDVRNEGSEKRLLGLKRPS